MEDQACMVPTLVGVQIPPAMGSRMIVRVGDRSLLPLPIQSHPLHPEAEASFLGARWALVLQGRQDCMPLERSWCWGPLEDSM